jgi:TrmH family RNA methyltransferase
MIARFRAARSDSALAVLEGFHAIKHAIRFGATFEQIVTRDAASLGALAARLAPDVRDRMLRSAETLPEKTFTQLAPFAPETGVIAIARRPPPLEALAVLPRTAPIVLLEDPSHLGNVGAVVRVAAGAGATAVLTTGSQDPWHPTAIRGSAGLHYALPVFRCDGLPAFDRPLIAIDPEGESLERFTIPADAVLAFGSERAGLSDELLARAHHRVRIPMREGVSSLNLATAVAVVMYGWRMGGGSRAVGGGRYSASP